MNDSVETLLEKLKHERLTEGDRVAQILEEAEMLSPGLGNVVRACAIPRKVDESIIQVLLDEKANSVETAARMLHALVTFDFVQQMTDGSFVYHDSVRELLLQDWRNSDAKSLEVFKTLNARLGNYYEGEAKQISLLKLQDEGTHLTNPAGMLSKDFQAGEESRKIDAMLQAIYHDTLRYPPAAFERFKKHYQECADAHAIRACHALIQGTRDQMERLEKDQKEQAQVTIYLREIRYREGCLAVTEFDFDTAEQIFRSLLASLPEPTRLRVRVLEELGSVLSKREKAFEALAYLEAAADVGEETGIDSENQALRLLSLAQCYQSLQQMSLSRITYEQALESARSEGNVQTQASVYTALARVLGVLGLQQESYEAAFASLDLISSANDVGDHQRFSLNWQLMNTPITSLPEILDALYFEALALLDKAYDEETRDELKLQYAGALRRNGRLTLAKEVLDSLKCQGAALTAYSYFERALLEDACGNRDAALECYGRTLGVEKYSGEGWLRYASHFNKGNIQRDASRFQLASKEFSLAKEGWRKLGLGLMQGMVEVSQATVKIYRGDAAESIDGLLRIHRTWEKAGFPYRSQCLTALGRAYRCVARFDESSRYFEESLRLCAAAGEFQEATEIALELSKLQASRGLWDEAANWCGRANGLLSQLGSNERYRPSTDDATAAEHDSRAVYLRNTLSKNGSQVLNSARAASEEALRLRPSHLLYKLNHSYLASLQGDWDVAAEGLQGILASEATWAQSPSLRKRLLIWQQNALRGTIENNSPSHRLIYEIGPALRPQNAQQKNELQESTPALREKIISQFGLNLPALRVQVNEYLLEQNNYAIHLDGRLLEAGWISVTARTDLPFELVTSLETVLKHHLSDFFSYEDFRAMLSRWSTKTGDEHMSALPDRVAKAEFWDLLRRRLAREESIEGWPDLLPSFLESIQNNRMEADTAAASK